ncbi:ribokinase [Roseitranquillus sediminis]|uniref:ribokinase n=1 Tax=Roseitranquillus sediminis TaxID=2809051 RepID=UPI001D0CA53A|nr:ribokinase [Roseitranquillus sediminis]MBM9593807.1 ribokinase [Roseitranquillus sediminis]
MTVWNFGSINIDHFYAVPHLPGPGETIAATAHSIGLGGKGANQSVAAARAGASVRHIGCVGRDGLWARERMRGFGVNVSHVVEVEAPTGHAIIEVAEDGENAIVVFPGANAEQDRDAIQTALSSAERGDLLLLQNETTLQAEAAQIGSKNGLRVVYSAAPFSIEAVRAVMDHVWLLVVNEIEGHQLECGLGRALHELPSRHLIVTRGAAGAEWLSDDGRTSVPAMPADVVDTTGAGDTFLGYVAACLDRGCTPHEALTSGAAAAALKVTRRGTSDAIPSADEVAAFVQGRNGASSPQS